MKDKYIEEYLVILKKARLGMRLSQAEAGLRTLGVSAAWVSNAETGTVALDKSAAYFAALMNLNVRSRRTSGGAKRVGRRRSNKPAKGDNRGTSFGI